jgi:hypothetical protein
VTQLRREEVEKYEAPDNFVRSESIVSFIVGEMGNHLANFFFVLLLALLGAGIAVFVEYLSAQKLLPDFERKVLHWSATVMCVCGAGSISLLAIASLFSSFGRFCEVIQRAPGLGWLRDLWYWCRR